MHGDREPEICVVLASHNRREKTLSCLEALHASAADAPSNLHVVLIDDASDDGTPEAVENAFPETVIVSGTGDMFWNQAMRTGIDTAMQSGPDFVLLLNDDVRLDSSALLRLQQTIEDQENREFILVASLRDPDSGEISYGGLLRSSAFHPLRFNRLVMPDDKEVSHCDTFNANCVLIPAPVIRSVGNLSPEFIHSKGDYDYGLRAAGAGIKLLVAPATYGTCKRDGIPYFYPRYNGIFKDIYDCATNPKRMSLRELIIFYRRHIKWFWWLYVPLPYIRLMAHHFMPGRRQYITSTASES